MSTKLSFMEFSSKYLNLANLKADGYVKWRILELQPISFHEHHVHHHLDMSFFLDKTCPRGEISRNKAFSFVAQHILSEK